MNSPLVELRDVSKQFTKKLDVTAKIARTMGFSVNEQTVHAVDNVTLSIDSGTVLGLVGESGCGKSTLGRIVSGIYPPSQGTVSYRGRTVSDLQPSSKVDYTLAVQMIFQDPFSSLNPRQKVGEIISEAPRIHGLWPSSELDTRLNEIMERVGLDPEFKHRSPQRIGIARALAVGPEFIVCDEAVASLDVSIQAQILNLFMDLREELDLTYLFISHDLGVVRHLSDHVAIMYLGRIVEHAPRTELFEAPNHPYTKALLSEIPDIQTRHRKFEPIKGEIPSPLNPPSGCVFHPRCPSATKRCQHEAPSLVEITPHRMSACHLNE
jgi:peptide/nickel transport system ATP-binding protein